jgi:hypothetical protein
MTEHVNSELSIFVIWNYTELNLRSVILTEGPRDPYEEKSNP